MTGAKRKLADRWKHRPAAPPASTHIANEARAPVEQARIDHTPQIDYALIFRERIKRLGDDGLKEEFQLRAIEAVVGLYLANHPGVGVDEANAVVRTAIAQGATREKTTP